MKYYKEQKVILRSILITMIKSKLKIVIPVVAFSLLVITCNDLKNTSKEIDASTGTELAEKEAGFESLHAVSQNPTTVPLSPQESLHSFRLPKGYHLELVASEPMISEPTAIAWDGNGRMYVAQMETYMQTIDAKGEYDPRSRIMLLEDTDNDGKMDKSNVFIDQLLAPRSLLCAGGELLVNETNTFNIDAYKDSNGDGKADQKRSVFQTENKAYGNVEHQRSGMDWNLDNWIYVTTDPVRFRYRKGQLQVDSLPYGNNGQWGITHDNYGRMFYSRAASGKAASGFQINPVYGQLDVINKYEDSIFSQVWPIIKTPDVNGGPGTLRPDSTIFGFTSVCGQSVFRGDRLPGNIQGDYLAAEPVGRFIRRAKISSTAGKIQLKNVYDQDEFIASSDMNFRPVNTYTGPDGCLYIVDMYRGVIQEATWAQPGSFIYSQIMSKGLEKNTKNGRIYRLVHDGFTRGQKPHMLDKSTGKLVTYLDHPNGWWRDNAQKEIVVRGDKSIVPSLKLIALGNKGSLTEKPSAIARLHALWTLEGLETIDKEMLLAAMKDPDAQVRKAAVRISESFLQKNDADIIENLKGLKSDDSHDVRIQLLLSLNQSKADEVTGLVRDILSKNADNEMLSAVQNTMARNEEIKKYGSKLVALKEPDRKLVLQGAAIFQSLCAACHGPEGQGLPGDIAPPLISKFKLLEHKDGVIKILLHGLKGPVDGKTYPDQMPPMGANNDEWIASVLNYMRYDLCMRSFPNMHERYINNFVLIQPEQVKKTREAYAGRIQPWTWTEINSDFKKAQEALTRKQSVAKQ